MDQQKVDQTIGELYRLKELYRTRGEALCDSAMALANKIVSSDIETLRKLKEEMDNMLNDVRRFNA